MSAPVLDDEPLTQLELEALVDWRQHYRSEGRRIEADAARALPAAIPKRLPPGGSPSRLMLAGNLTWSPEDAWASCATPAVRADSWPRMSSPGCPDAGIRPARPRLRESRVNGCREQDGYRAAVSIIPL